MTGRALANSLPVLSFLLFLEALCCGIQPQMENFSSVLTKSLKAAGKCIVTLPSGTKRRIGGFCGK